MEMQTDYVTMKTPIITSSIFIEALAYDMCYMMPEMQAKIPARVSLLNDERGPLGGKGGSRRDVNKIFDRTDMS